MNETQRNEHVTSGYDSQVGGKNAQNKQRSEQSQNGQSNQKQKNMQPSQKPAQEKTSGLFDGQKQRLMSGIDALSSAIKSTTEELRRDGTSPIADYAEKLGQNIGDVKEWLNELSLDKAITTTRDFARRRPEVLLLGMFGAGLLVGRFLKSATVATSEATNEFTQEKSVPPNAEVH